MARLLGFIANRPDLCNRFADAERDVLTVRRKAEEQWGWGLGFIQGGEALLKRRPLDDRETLNIADMLDDVRSDILIGQIRHATVGSLRTENTHPFRYRQWMFADTGTVEQFSELRTQLYDTLPNFLQRSLRGDTDSELLFHLFLSFLHDSGKLDRPIVPASDAFSALKSCLGLLDRIGKDAGLNASRLNIIVTTHEYVMASHRGAPMAYRVLKGREDFEPLVGGEGPSKLRMPDLEPCRLCVVASDFDSSDSDNGKIPADWIPVPEGAMISFTRTDEPTIIEA